MKKFCRRIFAIIALISLISICSCQKDPMDITLEEWLESGRSEISYIYLQEHPNGNSDPENQRKVEYTAEELVAYSEKKSYSISETNQDPIIIIVETRDGQPRQMVAYIVPFVEKYVDEQWQRLYYFQSPFFNRELQWIGSDINAIRYGIYLNDIYPTAEPGLYRAVAFMGKDCVVYAEFELTE